MSRKIKIHSLNILFHLFSFLADKTGGWKLFVKPKLIIGSLILGLGITACNTKNNDSTQQNNSALKMSDSIESVTECYAPVISKLTDTLISTNKSKTFIHRKVRTSQYNAILKDKKNESVKTDSLIETSDSVSGCYIVVDSKIIETDSNTVFLAVDQLPEFPGGYEELFKFINNNMIDQPAGMCYSRISGRVICRFVVEKDGSISNIEVVRSLEESLDKEAIRIIKKMPKWIPGKLNGKIVRAQFLLPINFRLQ